MREYLKNAWEKLFVHGKDFRRKEKGRGRLRVVSNFGDCDCGAGKIHTRARESSRRRDAKGAPKISNFRRSLRVASPRNFARARVYFARSTITIAKIRDYSQSKVEGTLHSLFSCFSISRSKHQAPVVQKLDSAIHRINHYPADK